MTVYNIEAEQSILGCILLDGPAIKEVMLQPENFYDQKHIWIFEAMKRLEKKEAPIDIRTVTGELETKKLEHIGNVSYLAELCNAVPHSQNFKVYEKLVLDTWKLRQAEQVINSTREEIAATRSVATITDTIKKLSRLDELGYEDDFDLSQKLANVFDKLEKAYTGQEVKGIGTGFSDLNELTHGWKDGELIIIGARPSMGKTAFALSTAAHASKNNVIVSIFSLEMEDESLLARMISQEGRIDASKMQDPKKLEDMDWTKLTNSMGIITDYKLFIYDKPAVTIQEIRAKLRKLHREYPDHKHLTILDYLQLVKVPGKDSRNIELGEVSRELKIMAREFKQPIIALSQLSRSVEQRADKHPIMSDIRESGNIEQDADMIIFLYRDDYYDVESQKKNVVELKIAKHRNGPTGLVELVFLRNFNQFAEIARR